MGVLYDKIVPMPTYKLRNPDGETLLDQLLHTRGIRNPDEKQAFLNPEYATGCHNPMLLKDMEKVVTRIKKAVAENEKITIYSDFDADGIPGAVVLHDFFKKIGYTNFDNYIPHRHREGFGVHVAALDEIALAGSKLVITIDCGIADTGAAERSKILGIDLIITDHHTPGEILPDCFAIINPKQPGCEYPEKMLCGAGVIYKVVQALVPEFGLKEGTEKWWLDMVGIATLSDMVPLTGENRIFAHFGLVVLRKAQRLGFRKLLASLKINPVNLVEEDITFMVTPRINAASRMADPRDAFRLLSTTSDAEADEMVKHLNSINDDRKVQVAHLVKQIHKNIEERNLADKPVIVLGNPDWKPPVLGLAATNIVREYNKPVFLWGRSEEDIIKGSCRSPEGVDIVSIMRSVENPDEIYINMGGHSASGGFAITNTGIHRFEEALISAYEKVYTPKPVSKNMEGSGVDGEGTGVDDETGIIGGGENSGIVIFADSYIKPREVGFVLWNTVAKLSPYGEGNPKPLFMLKEVEIDTVKMFGKNKEHIEISFRDPADDAARQAKAIKFFAADDEILIEKLKVGKLIDMVAHMEKSMFKSYPEYRLRIVDVL